MLFVKGQQEGAEPIEQEQFPILPGERKCMRHLGLNPCDVLQEYGEQGDSCFCKEGVRIGSAEAKTQVGGVLEKLVHAGIVTNASLPEQGKWIGLPRSLPTNDGSTPGQARSEATEHDQAAFTNPTLCQCFFQSDGNATR